MPENTPRVDADVVIAGAGPAGSAAALVLARAGRNVLLLDARQFPRDKVCGDLIGTDAVATLARLGIRDVALAGAMPLTGAVLYAPSGRRAGARPRAARPARSGDARVLRRALLDARLLAVAREAGARFATSRVLGVLRDSRGVVMGLRTVAGDVHARLTIGADGWGSAVARGLGSAVATAADTAVVARAYVRGAGELGPYMHFFVNRSGDGYGWLFPLGDDAANVGLGFIRGEPGGDDPRAALARFLGTRSPAGALLQAAAAEPAATWPIPLGPPRGPVAAPGVLLTGDAAALASPLSGSGIHHALASGAAAAHFAGDALGGRDGAWRVYAAWIRTHLAARLSAERIVHRIAGTPERIGPWLTLARIVPGAERALSSALLALG